VLIVLEGSDGAGKSHLAAAIRDYWPDVGSPRDFQLIHTGPPNPPDRCVYQEYESQLDSQAELVMSDSHLMVLDRWHLGDRIYGPHYRGFARYTEGGLLHTEMALSSLGAVKVICSPPLEVVQKRVADDGDDYISQEDIPRIHREYLAHAERYGYHVIGTQHVSTTIEFLLRDAHGKARRARYLAKCSAGTYTGALYPECILAGDELGGTAEKQAANGFTRPFTPAAGHASSEWLMSAICRTGFLTTLGMVNVNHPGVDAAAVAALRPRAKWVALGARASKTLENCSVQHTRFEHPQHARRFRSQFHDEYAEELRQAIQAG
jgi:hypothetical protein